jgi:hypothetical protein
MMSSGAIRPLDRAHDAQLDWTTLIAQHIRDFICSEAAKPRPIVVGW